MPSIILDEMEFPIVLARFIASPRTEDIEAFLKRGDACLAARESYVLIIEGTSLKEMGQVHRTQLADWLKRRNDLIAKYCVGQAYVFTSVLQRMILRSILMMQPLPAPYVVSPTIREAKAWARRRLTEHEQRGNPQP